MGTGLGYIVGSEVAEHSPDWRWGLRVTPFVGIAALVAVYFLMIEPGTEKLSGQSNRLYGQICPYLLYI